MPVQQEVLLINMDILFAVEEYLNNVEKDTGQYDTQIDIFWSSGACMIVRSDAWKKCGGFDAGFLCSYGGD